MDNNASSLKPDESVLIPKPDKTVSTEEAAKILGIKPNEVKSLVDKELLKEVTPGMFNAGDLVGMAAPRGISLSQEAAQVEFGLQRALTSTLNVVQTLATVGFAGIVTYAMVVTGFVVAYAYKPSQVAGWINQKDPSVLQAVLQSPGHVALGILKYAEPTAYKTVSQNTIINANDVLTVGKNGSITPTGALIIPKSSYLQIISTGLIKNLNADFLRGLIPGTTTGDLAVIGKVSGLSDGTVNTNTITDGEVKNADLAQITDTDKVAGSAVQINGSGGLTNNSGLSLLTTCADSEILKWNDTNGAWECQADQGTAGSGITSVREGGVTVASSATALDFLAGDFIITESPSTIADVAIDYANSKIVRSDQSETISGTWTFPIGTVLGTQTFGTNTITDSGALTVKTTTGGALTLDSGTVGAVNLGTGASSKAVTVGNSTGTSSLSLLSGSGGVAITGATTFNSTPIVLGAASTILDMTGAGTLGINTTTNRAITTGSGLFTMGGAATVTGALTANSSLSVAGDFDTPSAANLSVTGSQDNVTLGAGTGSLFRYTGAADATFTGIAGGTDGRFIRIMNASSSNLVLANLSGSSSSSNQINTGTGGNVTIATNVSVGLQYDATSAKWRMVVLPATPSSVSGFAFIQGGNGFGTTASLGTTDANLLNLITSGAARFSVASGAPTITGQGSTTLTSTGTLDLSSAAASALTINSGTTGAINIGSDTDAENISISNGAGVKNLVLGSSTSTSTTTIMSGTSGIFIGDRAVTKAINIGGVIFNAGDTISIATSGTTADIISVGNTNAATTISLTGGTSWSMSSGGVLTLAGGASPDIKTNAGSSLTIDSGTTGAINLGTASNAKTLTIGNTTGATAVNVNAGSGGASYTTSNGLTFNPYGTSAGNTTENRFAELAANGSSYVGFKASDSLAGNVVWVLPVADGSNGQVLSTDGLKNLSWATPGACPGCVVNTAKFEVDETTGNILKINNVTTSFPSSQGGASSVLTNDGAGNLTWNAPGAGSASLNSVTAAGGNSSIGNTNYNIAWNWSLTGATDGLDISENVASSGTGYLQRVATIATSTAKPFSIGARGTTIFDTTATGGLVLGDSATLNTPITLQSGTGAINIGTDAVAHTITLGNVTGVTSLVLNAGTGNIDIGTTAQARATNVGTGGAAQTVTVGSTNGASTLTLNSGTGALNIGTSIAKILTIGNTTGATAVNINSGSGGINFDGATTITGSNTFTTGTGTSTFNSTLLNLAGNSTVIDMSGTGSLGLNTTTNRAITTGNGTFATGTGLFTATGGLTIAALGNFSTLKGADFTTTGTTDNVSLGGGTGALFRYNGAGTATFSGIAGGSDGRIIRIMNISASSLTIANNGSGTAANNVVTQTGSNIVLTQNETITLQYDSGASVWRVMSLPANSTTLGGFAFLQSGNAFGATATLGTTDANILNIITGGATRFSVAAASSTLTGTGTSIVTSTGSNTFSSAAGSALNVTSGTTGILTLDSGSSGDVNLGTGTTAKNINVGGTGANTVAIANTQAAGSLSIGNAMVAGTITIGGTGQTGTITLGSSSGINALSIADGAGATTLNLANNQTAGAVNIGAGMTTGTISVGGTGAQTGTITFGGGTGAQIVNLGTGGTGVKTVNVGTGSAANIISIGTTQTGGSIALGSAMTGGTIDIGNSSGAMTGTINIGGSTGAQALNFGGGNTGIKTVAIAGGTAANVVTIANNQTGGSVTVGNAMTGGTITIGGTAATGTLTLGSSSAGNTVVLAGGTGATTLNIANAQTAGSVNIGAGMTTGTITIGGTGLQTGTIAIGTGTGAQTLNFGTGGTGAKTVTLGSTASTGATTIQSGSGNIILEAAGTGTTGKVQIGTTTGKATPDLLVLDAGTGDPTGVAGGMYYNSSTGKFRCFENASWTNCVGEPSATFTDSTLTGINPVSFTAATVLWNDGTYPNITVTRPSTKILVSVVIRGNADDATDAAPVFQLRRATGANPTCSSTQVDGDFVGGFQTINALLWGASASIIDSSTFASGDNVRYAVCTATTGTNDGNLESVTISMVELGADLAEKYYTTDDSISEGDVVAIDSALPAGVKKSASAYDRGVIGVVSTAPGIVLDDAVGIAYGRAVPVALAGRIPVKVSTENGIVKAGDFITASSVPGVAMKATKAGAVIGQALNDYNYNGSVGLVTVFVKNAYYTGDKLIPTSGQGGDAQFNSRNILTEMMANPDVVSAMPTNLSEITTDRVNAAVEIITPKVTAKDIEVMGILTADTIRANRIEGLEVFTNRLADLSAQVATVAGTVDQKGQENPRNLVAGLIDDLFKKMVEFFGNVIFHGDVMFAGRPTFNKDTAGFALVVSGQNQVEVKFDREYATAPVVNANLNLVGDVNQNDVPGYAIYDLSTKGFKIKLVRNTGFDIMFSWIALGVKDANTSQGQVSGASSAPVGTPAPSQNPTVEPSATPSSEPTATPSVAPTDTPTPVASPTP